MTDQGYDQSRVAHQLIDGYGIRFEVLCGKPDWQTANADITRTPNPCSDCLVMLDLAATLKG